MRVVSNHMRAMAIVSICVIAMSVFMFFPQHVQATDLINQIDMYRLYNRYSGEHFYTGNVKERDSLRNAGWAYEGVGWMAPAYSNTPVYRLYNPNSGDHHYTTNTAERDILVSAGWRDEGIGWYSSDENRNYPVYRQYNPNAHTGSHNFTLSQSEESALVRAGWRAEGVAWYAVGSGYSIPQPEPTPTPVPDIGENGSGSGNAGDVYYKNCAAVRAAGKAPLYSWQPGYRPALDRDHDGVACE